MNRTSPPRASRLIGIAALAVLLAGTALANTQQQRMTACNKEAAAKNLSGDARRAFMSDCLSAKPQMTQQERTTRCNKEAGAGGTRRRRAQGVHERVPEAEIAGAPAGRGGADPLRRVDRRGQAEARGLRRRAAGQGSAEVRREAPR